MNFGQLLTTTALASLLAAAAGASVASADDFDGTVRVGVQIAITGDLSALGEPASRGIKYAADVINKKGGLDVGGKHYKIELVMRDDGSSPETARAIMQQLITQDKVDVVVAGVGSNIVAGVTPIAERYGVPTITTFAYSPKVIPANVKYSFVDVMSTADEFLGPIDFLKNNGAQKIELVATNDDLGEGFAQQMPAYLKSAGLDVVGIERFETNTTNFAPIMARLKQSGADAIIVEAADPLSYQFRVAQKQYKACDTFKYSVYEYGPPLQPDWVNATKDAGIGGLGQSFWWPSQKGSPDKWFGDNAELVKQFTADTGKAPNWSLAQGIQAMDLMGLAIEQAGKIDRDAIAQAFLDLKGTTFYGPIAFDPKDHFNRGFVKSQLVLQQQGPTVDDAKIIWPLDQANAKVMPDTCGPAQ
jgi:branched-chain amino acid transport system substrate-binding protein